jgi:threonine/homoserine/homoserine lactone efflux protein
MTSDLVALSAAATLLIVAPGSDSLLVMRNTLRGGRRLGVLTSVASEYLREEIDHGPP